MTRVASPSATSSPSSLVGREELIAELARLVRSPAGSLTLVGLPGVGKSALAALFPGDEIATALRPRGVPGEHVIRVPPLEVPALDAPPDRVLSSASVALLLAHATRTGRGIQSPAERAPSLARIAVAASGLPFALLAAAELTALHPLERVAEVLGTPSEIPVAHGAATTFADVFVPVYESLSPAARALLARIAPHRSGAALDERWVATSRELRELVDADLATRVASTDPSPRFRVPSLVARCFLATLGPAERDAVRSAHALATAERVLADASRAQLAGHPDARRALAESSADLEDALAWALDAADAETADALARAAIAAARIGGSDLATALAPIDALARHGRGGAATRARLAMQRAAIQERAGDADAALASLEQAAALAAGLELVRGEVALAMGMHQMHCRVDYVRARAAFEDAARSPDLATSAQARISLGGAYVEEDRFAEAIAVLDAARRSLRGHDAGRLDAMAVTNLLLSRIGHWPDAVSARPRSLDVDDGLTAAALFDAIGDARGAAFARLDTGLALTTLLRFEQARDLVGATLATFESIAHPGYVFAECDLACAALALGDAAGAETHARRGRAFADRSGLGLLSAVARAEHADVAWETGDLRSARDALTHALRLFAACEDPARTALVAVEAEVLGVARTGDAPVAELDPAHAYARAIAIYRALLARRAGTPVPDEDERVLPWLENVVGLMATAPATRGADGRGIPWAVWLAVRRFVRELDTPLRRRLLERAHGLEGRAALLIDVDTRSVRAPDGRWIDLSRREKPFALLEALAGAPWERPRPTRSVLELAERTWAGEKILPTAAASRVYVALATLRKLGAMRDVIVHEGDGYRFAPSLDVRVFRERYTPA